MLCAASIPGACLAELLWPVVPAFLVVSVFISVVSMMACGVHVVVQLGRERWRQPLPVSDSESWVDGAISKMTSSTISPSSTMDVLPSAEDAAVEDAEAGPPANADLNGMPTSWMRDALIGMLGGFFSVMSATGGSFMTIPMLLLADASISPAHAVCLGQAISVPITACTALVAAVSPMATLDVPRGRDWLRDNTRCAGRRSTRAAHEAGAS